MEKILDKIESPKDLKPLSISEMKELAEEIRSALLKKISIKIIKVTITIIWLEYFFIINYMI